MKSLGLPAFRAGQLEKHYFQHYTSDPAQMTDLPASGREELVHEMLPNLLTEVRRLETDRGDTIKFLWKLHDGALVESVLMRYPGRITLCVSSQAGCGMNCPFCATGQAGLTRNMSAAEIIEQVVRANAAIRAGELGPAEHADERVTNIVFMGMGEPLANYNRVMQAVRTMVDKDHGLGMSARGVTVSTVGLVPAINKLAAEDIPVTFALSLHAPDDQLRDEMIPINSRWKVDEALDAARGHFEKTGRRVSIEYALIKDMNDHAWRADLLATKLNERGRGWGHVNPIPLNPTPGSVWTASEKDVQREFVRRLQRRPACPGRPSATPAARRSTARAASSSRPRKTARSRPASPSRCDRRRPTASATAASLREMVNYRYLGNSGFKVSEITYGVTG